MKFKRETGVGIVDMEEAIIDFLIIIRPPVLNQPFLQLKGVTPRRVRLGALYGMSLLTF